MAQIIEFFQMGGYALYVWVSYGLTALLLVLNVLLPMAREKGIIKTLKRRQERENCS